MADLDFDFLDTPETSPENNIEHIGPNLKSLNAMTPRKFAQSVLEVYEKLGGATWLFTEAKADSKGFLDLLKKLIPKSVQLEDLTGLSVTLIDQFGNEMQIQATGTQPEASPASAITSREPLEPGQLQSATGGSPSLDLHPENQGSSRSPDLASSEDQEDITVDVRDMFE